MPESSPNRPTDDDVDRQIAGIDRLVSDLGRIGRTHGVRTILEGGDVVVVVADLPWESDETDSRRWHYLLGAVGAGATVRIVTEADFRTAVEL